MQSSYGARIAATVGAVVLVIVALGVFFGAAASLDRTGPTQVAVVRNGGIFDSKNIRETVGPASSIKVPGLYSTWHKYIAGTEQRYYKVSSDPSLGEKSGADFVTTPTKDGVNVEIDAQVSFKTAFTDSAGNITPCENAGCDQYPYLVDKFDTQFGNRSFASKTGGNHKVWEGNDGWNAFLDSIFRPVVENAFREQIGAINCADLVSSCALVQSSGKQQSFVVTDAGDNQANFEKIQSNVQGQIETGIREALGDEYLTDFKVQLTKVTLPEKVQNAIDDAQASFAQIAEARAQNIQSKYQARANYRLAASYKDNPILAQVQIAKELKGNSNATIIVGNPGMGFNLGR